MSNDLYHRILFPVNFCLFLLLEAQAINCYNCSDCPIPFKAEGVAIAEGCHYCMSSVKFYFNGTAIEERKCGVDHDFCISLNFFAYKGYKKGGSKTLLAAREQCCHSDLCNHYDLRITDVCAGCIQTRGYARTICIFLALCFIYWNYFA
ncbi:unnamed protein product [Calicophoron daubneyi]|uniref:UPAR/Ly6 domain-containing protein n=1 Tax=Calicophoron daubneyi TaxID=300641 RepID=A0AAV2TLD3_CALDB